MARPVILPSSAVLALTDDRLNSVFSEADYFQALERVTGRIYKDRTSAHIRIKYLRENGFIEKVKSGCRQNKQPDLYAECKTRKAK